MSTIIHINEKELAKVAKIPKELEDKELVLEVKPAEKQKNRFERFFKNRFKVDELIMPSREERNER